MYFNQISNSFIFILFKNLYYTVRQIDIGYFLHLFHILIQIVFREHVLKVHNVQTLARSPHHIHLYIEHF